MSDIQHAGVKGMKWGVRKKRSDKRLSRRELALSKHRSAAREQQLMNTYRNRDRYSTNDLKNKVARMKLEDQLYEYANKAKGRTDTRSKGRKMIDNAIKSPTTKKIALELASMALESAIAKSGDSKGLAISNRLIKAAK